MYWPKFSYFFFLSYFSLISCNKKEPTFEQKTIAYYQFNDLDNQRNSIYKLNQIIVFENELAEQLQFQVTSFDIRLHEEVGTGIGFFTKYAATYYYHDRKDVWFHSINDTSHVAFAIQFHKIPSEITTPKYDAYTTYPSYMTCEFMLPNWNYYGKDSSSSYNIVVDFTALKMQLNCFGKIYNNVFEIIADGKILQNPNPNEITKVYYDENSGIVGFDDKKNQHWRLK